MHFYSNNFAMQTVFTVISVDKLISFSFSPEISKDTLCRRLCVEPGVPKMQFY